MGCFFSNTVSLYHCQSFLKVSRRRLQSFYSLLTNKLTSMGEKIFRWLLCRPPLWGRVTCYTPPVCPSVRPSVPCWQRNTLQCSHSQDGLLMWEVGLIGRATLRSKGRKSRSREVWKCEHHYWAYLRKKCVDSRKTKTVINRFHAPRRTFRLIQYNSKVRLFEIIGRQYSKHIAARRDCLRNLVDGYKNVEMNGSGNVYSCALSLCRFWAVFYVMFMAQSLFTKSRKSTPSLRYLMWVCRL